MEDLIHRQRQDQVTDGNKIIGTGGRTTIQQSNIEDLAGMDGRGRVYRLVGLMRS